MKRWVRSLFRKAAQIFTPLYGLNQRDFGSSSLTILPRTRIDYASEIGDGLGSSVLMSPIKWIQRTFPEAQLEVVHNGKVTEVVKDHPVIQLLTRPNAAYTGAALWMATIFSYIVGGEGYWIKIREDVTSIGLDWWKNITGPVRQLWYVPHWRMTPKGSDDGLVFIASYEYSVNGTTIPIPPENVIHFRNGLDPRDPRHGMSLIYSELREIFTDDETSNMIASLVRNLGIPGMVISPDKSGVGTTDEGDIDIPDVEELKAYVNSYFTGDKRGQAMVFGGPVKVQEYGFNPKQLAVDHIRNVAEERICAAIGIPAAVVGFGTGIQQTKVGATMYELIKLAWHGCLIPMQKAIADQLKLSLLAEFEPKPEEFEVRFNQSGVAALQEDQRTMIEKVNIAVVGGWLRVDQAQALAGFAVDPTQALYLRGLNIIETPATDSKRLKSLKVAPIVQTIIDGAESGQATSEQRKLIASLARQVSELETDLDSDMQNFFQKMGGQLSDIALDLLEAQKASFEDEILVDKIMGQLDDGGLRTAISNVGEAHYLRVSKATYKTIQLVMGLAVDLPDFRARAIMAAGGRRLGLVDLSKSVRDRLFRELTAGRSLGEGPIELARRIRDFVPAGTWSSPKVRAKVIARTETLHAQRMSALDAYSAAENVSAVMVFDNRTGYNDEECMALDGKIVTIEEAEALMDDEHPNGTRSFSPVVT